MVPTIYVSNVIHIYTYIQAYKQKVLWIYLVSSFEKNPFHIGMGRRREEMGTWPNFIVHQLLLTAWEAGQPYKSNNFCNKKVATTKTNHRAGCKMQ
jgi:hypothetical protein